MILNQGCTMVQWLTVVSQQEGTEFLGGQGIFFMDYDINLCEGTPTPFEV